MYYIVKGIDTCFVARGPKEITPDIENLEVMDIRYFDYDSEAVWIDDALKYERRRVMDDPYAMAALDAEKDRRAHHDDENNNPPWFDDAASLVADFSMALEEEVHSASTCDGLNNNDWDENIPVDTKADLSKITSLITSLADIQHEEMAFDASHPTDADYEKWLDMMTRGDEVRDAILRSDYARSFIVGNRWDDDDWEDDDDDETYNAAWQLEYSHALNKIGHVLLTQYSFRRVEEEIAGRRLSDDLFYAAANLLEHATIEFEKMHDASIITEEDEDEEPDDPEKYEALRDDLKKYIVSKDELMSGIDWNAMGEEAEKFADYIKHADVNDPRVQYLIRETEEFLNSRGFNLDSLTGLKAAQAWLEKARVQDVYSSDIENAFDWHMGEARIDAMLKIVKDRIERRLKS